jgi:hypothetical protein
VLEVRSCSRRPAPWLSARSTRNHPPPARSTSASSRARQLVDFGRFGPHVTSGQYLPGRVTGRPWCNTAAPITRPGGWKGSPRRSVSRRPVTPTSQCPSKPLAAAAVGDRTCHSTPERQSRVERSDNENRSAAEARRVPLTASVIHSGSIAGGPHRRRRGGPTRALDLRPGPCSAVPQHRRRSPKTAVRAGATGEACRGLPPAPSDPPDLIPHRSVAFAPERPHSPRGPSVAGTRSPGTRHAPHWVNLGP